MTRFSWLSIRTRGAALFAVAALAILSAGCIKADIGISVSEDGSGTISVLTAIDKEAFDSVSKSFGDTGKSEDPSDVSKVDKSKLPPGSKVESYSEGKYRGLKVTVPFKSVDEVPNLVEQASNAGSVLNDIEGSTGSGGSDSKMFDKFSLKNDGGNWTFEATVPPPQGTGDSSNNDFISADQVKLLFKDASFVVRMKLPGHIVSHNGDSEKNGEVTWKLDIFGKDARTLSAKSAPGGGSGDGFPILPVIGGLVVLLIIGGVVLFLLMKRKPSSPLFPPAPPAPPTTPAV